MKRSTSDCDGAASPPPGRATGAAAPERADEDTLRIAAPTSASDRFFSPA